MDADFSSILWEMDGGAIEAESFRRIDDEVDPAVKRRFSEAEWRVVRRLIHTSADFSIAEQLEFSPGAVEAGLEALRRGALIYSDSNMIKAGLSVPKLRRFHPGYGREGILCPVADEAVWKHAAERGITRALAAVELHAGELSGSLFLCGNAPLALAGMIKLCVEQGIAPALVIGMPVGFVNVAESKKLLDLADVPFIRINGRRGGSPLAVAALHGIMEGAL